MRKLFIAIISLAVLLSGCNLSAKSANPAQSVQSANEPAAIQVQTTTNTVSNGAIVKKNNAAPTVVNNIDKSAIKSLDIVIESTYTSNVETTIEAKLIAVADKLGKVDVSSKAEWSVAPEGFSSRTYIESPNSRIDNIKTARIMLYKEGKYLITCKYEGIEVKKEVITDKNIKGTYTGEHGKLIIEDSGGSLSGTLEYHMTVNDQDQTLHYNFKQQGKEYVFTTDEIQPAKTVKPMLLFQGTTVIVQGIIGHSGLSWDSKEYFKSYDLQFTKQEGV